MPNYSGKWTPSQILQARGQDLWPINGPFFYVDDVFSTYLYEGNGGTTQSFTNNINLADEGGLVWIKSRTDTGSNVAVDTERGGDYQIYTNSDADQDYLPTRAIGFNTDGFSVSNDIYNTNKSGQDYASWSFRKQPGFFDVVTFSTVGDGTAQSFSHNLGSVPAVMIVKKTSSVRDWYTYHKDLNGGTNPEQYYIVLNGTAAEGSSSIMWDNTAPTSTQFTVGGVFTNPGNEGDFVAYLFASDDTRFGDNQNESIIKCGSFTSGTIQDIDLGWEPQWLLVKAAGTTGAWGIFDVMRGMPTDDIDTAYLLANATDAEATAGDQPTPIANGFRWNYTGSSGFDYIYIAIRRPMKTPTAGTEVYGASQDSTPTFSFPPDLAMIFDASGGSTYHNKWTDRLRGSQKTLQTSSTAAEVTESSANTFYTFSADGNQNTFGNSWGGPTYTIQGFKRATGFFDVVAYTGTGSATTQSHNLGVVPELIIVKTRSNIGGWQVYSSALGATKYLVLNENYAEATSSNQWNDTAPTASVFTVGTIDTNESGRTYIAYLFATLDGISKVGSYSGTGSNVDVDCGFTAGARFILIKRTDSTGDWYVYDSVRGIVAGNDPYLLINSTAAEVTGTDYIDPLSSGFTVTSSAPAGLNASGGEYIFLAIA